MQNGLLVSDTGDLSQGPQTSSGEMDILCLECRLQGIDSPMWDRGGWAVCPRCGRKVVLGRKP